MSGLAGILADHHPAGVYRWHAAFDVADVQRAVEHADWRFGHVDGWVHQDRAGFLADVAETLDLPGHDGRDFETLTDRLRDVPARTVLLWDGWGTLAREDRAAFDTALEVLGERSSADGPAFVTLLRGEGPEVDVPSLDS